MRFESPWAFLLLLAVPLLLRLWNRKRGCRAAAISFPSAENPRKAGASLRSAILFVPAAARAAALVLLVVAIARPQKGTEQVHDESKGVAVEMILDRSSSMGQVMEYDGQRMTRLDVVKSVFRKFVDGDARSGLKGRANDLVGMVVFAKYADTVAPLTLAHGALGEFLDGVRMVAQGGPEDSTSIGDALALAAARLKTAEETLARLTGQSPEKINIKSKVIILLTDGEQNSGQRNPIAAARLAKQWGIKVYTVFIGSDAAMYIDDPIFGRRILAGGRSGAGWNLMEQVAKESGGRAYKVESGDALLKVCEEIDRLERSEINTLRYLDYSEIYMPFALSALLLVCIEVLLSATVFRRIP